MPMFACKCVCIYFSLNGLQKTYLNNMSEEKKECKYQDRGRILQAKEEESDLKQERGGEGLEG